MINQVLQLFDTVITSKCYIDKYGRLAVLVKQAVPSDGRSAYKRFPVSCAVTSDCEAISGYFEDLLPDDRKKGVAFWIIKQPITYEPVRHSSSARQLRTGSAVVEFVFWGNLNRIVGESGANWCQDPELIQLDLIKALECGGKPIQTGKTWLNNVRMEITGIGNVNTFRQAMSAYSIENIEALSVFPYTGFTLTAKLSFVLQPNCISDFACSEVTPCADQVGEEEE